MYKLGEIAIASKIQ